MRAWIQLYGAMLMLQHVGALIPRIPDIGDEVQVDFCPDQMAYIEVRVTTHLAVNPVFVSTFCPGNTVLEITEGVTILVNNAPTTISTQVCASTTFVKTVTVTQTTSASATSSSSLFATSCTTSTASTLSTVQLSSSSVSITASTTSIVSSLSTVQVSSSSTPATISTTLPKRPITIASAITSCGNNAQLSCCNSADTSGNSANAAFGILSGIIPNLLSGQQGLGLFNGCSKLSVTGLIGLDSLLDSQCEQTATCCQDTSQSQNGLINLGIPCIALGSLL